MKAVEGLHYSSLLEVAEELRSRILSPVELTRATLSRIERLNPTLGAYYVVFADEALAQARNAEAEIARGGWRGPLHGIPIAFKDLYNLGPTTAGSRRPILQGARCKRPVLAISRPTICCWSPSPYGQPSTGPRNCCDGVEPGV